MAESVSGQDRAKNPAFWLASQSDEMGQHIFSARNFPVGPAKNVL